MSQAFVAFERRRQSRTQALESMGPYESDAGFAEILVVRRRSISVVIARRLLVWSECAHTCSCFLRMSQAFLSLARQASLGRSAHREGHDAREAAVAPRKSGHIVWFFGVVFNSDKLHDVGEEAREVASPLESLFRTNIHLRSPDFVFLGGGAGSRVNRRLVPGDVGWVQFFVIPRIS